MGMRVRTFVALRGKLSLFWIFKEAHPERINTERTTAITELRMGCLQSENGGFMLTDRTLPITRGRREAATSGFMGLLSTRIASSKRRNV
jgi:hypothetical protein